MASRNAFFMCPRSGEGDLNCWMNLVTPKGVLPTILPLPNLSSDCSACDYFNQNMSRSKGRRSADQLAYSSLNLLLEQIHFYETQLDSNTSNLSKRIEELSILKKVSDALLESKDLDKSLRLILTGATAGQAFGFNRAFIFLLNEKNKVLEGKMGVGPKDPQEAEKIWSELRQKKVTFDQMTRDLLDGKTPPDTNLSALIKEIRLPLDANLCLISRSLLERKAFNISPSQLNQMKEEKLLSLLSPKGFAVVPIVTERKTLGILVADNLITGEPILDEDVTALQTFANEAGIQIENLILQKEIVLRLQELEHVHNLLRENQNYLLTHEHLTDMGKLATTVAHEIKTPLVTIGGYARRSLNNLKNQKPDPHDLEIIISEVERLEKLISGILDYSKETKLFSAKVDLNRIVQETLEVLEEKLKSCNIQLKTKFSKDIKEVKLDPQRIKQVLFNLIANAIEAMPQGGSLTITTQKKKKSVKLEIEDTGKGITDEGMKNLFIPFYTSKPRGSGLGLAVSKKIIADHNGAIEVQSQVNVGTKFTILLPLNS
jgi:signal transduction histidine kinase